MHVVVAGATGLVGSAAVRQLLASPAITRVTAVVRRPWPSAPVDPRLHVLVADVGRLQEASAPWPADAVLCALGTTRRQAGSAEAFRTVDHGLVVALARAARAQDVPHFLLVSAIGASPDSGVFYNRVKGEAERDVIALGFEALTIARPSLLLGARTELRPLEVAMGALAWAVPTRWKPVHAERVAAALVERIVSRPLGLSILENRALRHRPG